MDCLLLDRTPRDKGSIARECDDPATMVGFDTSYASDGISIKVFPGEAITTTTLATGRQNVLPRITIKHSQLCAGSIFRDMMAEATVDGCQNMCL